MTCGYVDFLEDDDGRLSTTPPCPSDATHTENCNAIMGVPVCAAHACRCAVTLVEAERRREARVIPSAWMAL